MKRLAVILLVFVIQGCAFAQLGEDAGEFYASAELGEDAIRVAALDAPAFTGVYGREGLWQPISFLKERRGGVYLLEPYDPDRIPVLFVHGAGGTPQDWRHFIQKLDRTKYQAWVYYYPTGMPIEASAVWLNKFVSALHARHGFQRLVVGAHSMGGLVARRFLALSAQHDYAKLLVTFATPWGGVPLARLGVTLARNTVPSWHDLVPESEFLRALHADALPAAVKHHLFFGYRESGDAFDSDGVISVSSQLEPRIGVRAHVHGFKTDHSDILENAAVFKRFASVLAGFD